MVKLVSVESNVGGGKTTLIKSLMEKIKDDKSFILIKEPVDDWKKIIINGKDILTNFYENMAEVALPFQLIALLTRRRKILEKINEAKLLETQLGKEVILVTERTVHSDRYIFAEMLHQDGFINDYGMTAYKMWNDDFAKESTVNKTVYINIPPEICFNRVKKRNRPGEENITLEYLQKCQKAHDRFYDEHINKGDHMTIDTSNIIKETSEYDEMIDRIIVYFRN